MKKLLTLSLALLLCLTACEPKENHEVESEFEPETVVETEAEAEAETETETKPKRTPEEKISSPFKGMTDEEVISFFENVLGPNGADVMIFIDCPSPSPDLEKAWEAMEFEERKEAKKEFYREHLHPIAKDIGIPVSFCLDHEGFVAFDIHDAEEYFMLRDIFELWAKDDRVRLIDIGYMIESDVRVSDDLLQR